MESRTAGVGVPGFCLPKPAIAVLDRRGVVVEWSPEAQGLTGLAPGDAEGRPFARLLTAAPGWEGLGTGEPGGPEPPDGPGTRAVLAGASGDVDVYVWPSAPVRPGAAGHRHVLMVPLDVALEWGHGLSLLRATLAQDRVGMTLHDADLAMVWTNITPAMFGGPPVMPGDHLHDVAQSDDADAVEALLRQVLATGVPLFDHEVTMHARESDGVEWTLALSAMRMEGVHGEAAGVFVSVRDVSGTSRIRRHRDLLHRSASELGTSLDIERTARALAGIVTPELADLTTVDLAEPVLSGDEPPRVFGSGESGTLRAAVASAEGPWPDGLLAVGELYPELPHSPALRRFQQGESIRMNRDEVIASLGASASVLVPPDAHDLATVPLRARGRLLGSVTAWRTAQAARFTDDETELLAEIGSRAALAIDNARRYTKEHRTAVVLQQRLLPQATTDTPAAETAAVYEPASGRHGISGDWFDAIRLPSLRVALVVGDVIGHGLIASATMGRLRTAIQTFADLELDPADLLSHVDDLVHRLAAESPASQRDVVGATCLYAVHDPITCRCTVASAGQPPPVLISPDGTTTLIDVTPGPPLGVGGFPYESTTFDVEPGSVLALYTDGILRMEPYAGDDGVERLREALADRSDPAAPLAERGLAVVGDPGAKGSWDDVTLMLSRLRRLPADHVTSWRFPGDLDAVAEARASAVRQLSAWHLDDLAFTTELVVSELVTNAIRYAGGPVDVRLIRDRSLICEVTDPSNTQPRLVRAAVTDEGGRGLFIVAQCTSRWGCRYGRRGKTIWAEQPIAGPEDPVAAQLTAA